MQVIKPTPSQAAFVLKRFLKETGIDIQLGKAQEAIARVNGYTNWNSLTSEMDPKVGEPKAEDGYLRQQRPNQYELAPEKWSAVWLKVDNIDVYVERGERGVDVMLYPHGDQDHQLEALDAAQASFDDAKDAIADAQDERDDPEGNNASDKRQDDLFVALLTADRVQTSNTGSPVRIESRNTKGLQGVINGNDPVDFDFAEAAFTFRNHAGDVQNISLGALIEASYLGETGWVLPSGTELWVYQPKEGQAAQEDEVSFDEATAQRVAAGENVYTLVEKIMAAHYVRGALSEPPQLISFRHYPILTAILDKDVSVTDGFAPDTKVLEGLTIRVTLGELRMAEVWGPTGWVLPGGRMLYLKQL